MKKTWIWILIVGLLVCVIIGLVIALIVLHLGDIPLAPAGAPAATPAVTAAPEVTEAPEDTAASGTAAANASEAAPAGTANGTAASGDGAGASTLPSSDGSAALPPDGTGGSDFELPEGVREASGIITETASGMADGSVDPYSALDNMGDATEALGGDSPVDVSGATDALQDVISGVTGRNNNG